MTDAIEVGAYVVVFLVDNSGKYHVEASCWDDLDAAYHHWIERKIDRVCAITCVDGAPLLIAASRIGELCLATPETRAREREIASALKAESGFEE